jgi:hypothetical protein
MIAQQLSVFLENKSGRLTEVLEVLGEKNIKITALTVADTTEFGILRLIVSDPFLARDILREHSFTVHLSDVISVIASNEAKDYSRVLRILSDKDISVEYTYAFPYGNRSVLVLSCSNTVQAIEELSNNEMELLKSGDLYNIKR